MEEIFKIKQQLIEKYQFTDTDFALLEQNNISSSTVYQQLSFFENGIPKINLEKPAVIGDGIVSFSNEEVNSLIIDFEKNQKNISISKFVPASGAASRMFKFLIEFLTDFKPESESINAYINRKNSLELSVFMVGLEKFPFYNIVWNKTEDLIPDFKSKSKDLQIYHFAKTLVNYLDFANKPKGILPFHKTGKNITTPLEKHLQESLIYVDKSGSSKIHFTITPEFQTDFEHIIKFSNYKDVVVTYSYQKESTNTISVTKKNKLFRLQNGHLFFRPGGHGSLIENLNQIEADLIFIRNIDNVSHNHFNEIIKYKKALAGYLLNIQTEIFNHLKSIESDDFEIDRIKYFCENVLSCNLSSDFNKFSKEHQKEELFTILNRPIRVCGMVKNEGEPGGGPFWVNDNGNISLQIVESSQIDNENAQQKAIFSSATHFNPVDIVCGIKDYKGNKFNLKNFVNENTGFIAEKSKGNQMIKAYEHPGLWNGAMANWITLFVEVPLVTFSPVKTVNDLLKPAHQS